MTYYFTILGRMAGANELIHAANIHRFAGAKIKKSETQRAAASAVYGRIPRIANPIKIHFKWIEPNKKRDLDNIRYAAKFILDGLQESGKIVNDGWAQVVGMSDEWSVDAKNPRVEIKIEEIQHDN